MKAKIYAPSHSDLTGMCLQKVYDNGAAWASIQIGDEVRYEDVANLLPFCDPFRMTGRVIRKRFDAIDDAIVVELEARRD